MAEHLIYNINNFECRRRWFVLFVATVLVGLTGCDLPSSVDHKDMNTETNAPVIETAKDDNVAFKTDIGPFNISLSILGDKTIVLDVYPTDGERNPSRVIGETASTPAAFSAEKSGNELLLRINDRTFSLRIEALEKFGHASVSGMELSWPVSDDEGIYGLGERFDCLNQNGKQVEMWIEDAPGQWGGGASYFVTPMLLSSSGYAFWADDNPDGKFEVNVDGSGRCVYRRAGKNARFYVVLGDDLPALIRERNNVRGSPRGIPDWSWGPWVSRNSFETQAEAEEVLREMKARDLPVAAIVQEAWKGPSEPGHFNAFDQGRWANVSNYMAECKRDGVKNVLWQVPILHPSSPHFKEAEEKGYFVKDPQGNVSLREHWLAGFGNIDFTNPDAVRFWQDLIRPVVKMGVAGFKADDGEAIKADDVFFDGRRGWQMHNEYSRLYGKALQDLLDEENADGMLWARSGSLGCDQIPALWAGDQFANWQQMRSLIPAGLSSAMSGVAFWGHDIGGYIDQPSEELYIRWVQFGALSPLMQYHGIQRREPWEFGERAVAAYRRMAYFRMNLKPELIRIGKQAEATGMPVMRPMILAFPDDSRFLNTDDQYMLGDDLLVFPVLEEGARSRRVLIPSGTWLSLDGRRRYTGPSEMELPVALLDIPLLVREGAVLRMQLAEDAEPGEWSSDMPVRDWQVPVERVVFDDLLWNGWPDTLTRKSLLNFIPVTGVSMKSLEVQWYFDEEPEKVMTATWIQNDDKTVAFCLVPPVKQAVDGHPFTVVVTGEGTQEVMRAEGVWHTPIELRIEQVRQTIDNREHLRLLKAVLKNNTASKVRSRLYFSASDGIVVSPKSVYTELPPGEEETVRFEAKIPEGSMVGNAVVQALLAGPEGAVTKTVYKRLNRVPRWVAVGPFSAEKKEAFRTVFAPETIAGPLIAYKLENGSEVSWQPVEHRLLDESGSEWFDFSKRWPEKNDVAVYMMTRIYSEREQSIEMHAGSDDTLTVWLNGTKIYANESYRSASADQDTVELHLKAGLNTIMIKVGQHVSGWELLVQFTGKGGRPLRGARDGFTDYAEFTESNSSKRIVPARKPQYNPPRWVAAGPFPASGKTAFAKHFPPEDSQQANKVFINDKGEPVRWKQISTKHDVLSGAEWIDLQERWPGMNNAACYVFTKISSDRARRVLLHAGSDDTLTVWLNGRKVFAKEVYRGAEPDQENIPLSLQVGLNTLLIKVTQDVGGWMLYTRFTNEDGSPPLGLRSGFEDYDEY